MSAAERASEASSAEQANERSGACERISEWPGTIRVDFMPFLPRVLWWRTGGGEGGGAQWDEII